MARILPIILGVVLAIVISVPAPAHSESIALECPEDWVLSRDRCYRVYSEVAEWDDAVDHCQRYGGQLARVFGFAESLAITTLVTDFDSSITQYWIGLHVEEDGTVEWITGEGANITEGFWSHYQPAPTGRMCAYKDTDPLYYYEKASWALDNCKQPMPFVCQKGSCVQGMIQCRNGRCIKKELCDGVDDCGDNSDEMECDTSCKFHEVGAESGTIVFDRTMYKPFIDCEWVIEGPVGSRLKLQFVDKFGTEKDLDEVQVWAGGLSLEESELLARISGIYYEDGKAVDDIPIYYSQNNMAIVKVSSDVTTQDHGFTIDWSAESYGSDEVIYLEATETAKLLESPSYPERLPETCRNTWVITARPWRIITIQILDFDLGPGDYLEFRDGEDLSSPVLARMDMDSVLPALMSTENAIRVYLYTNQPENVIGFQLSYIEGCLASVVAADGYVLSPGYGAAGYANYQTCTWTLNSGNGRSFILIFEDLFGLEDGVDTLEVYDGGDDTAALLVEATGSVSPGSFESTGDTLFLRMTTNSIINDVGFKASFSSGCPEPNFSAETIFTPQLLDLSLGAEILVSCPPGYFFGQEEHYEKTQVTLTCIVGGWNARMIPRCEPIYCGMIPLVVNAYISSATGVQYTDIVTYECYGGYGIGTGSGTVECQADGEWTDPPSCTAASCSPLTAPTNGQMILDNGDGTSYGSVVKFECNTGYQILGAPIRYCSSTDWSGDAASCSKLQCPPMDVTNAVLSNTDFTDYGRSVTVTCNVGYRIVGASTVNCQLDQTYDSNPTCEDIDECVENPDGCDQTCTNSVGSFSCSCDPGFESVGFNCEDIDECASVPCDHICNNSPTGSYTCECNAGFDLFTDDGTNGFNIPAGETGTLAGDTNRIDHTCVPTSCPDITVPMNGAILTTATSFYNGDVVYFHCDLGFQLVGQETITCGMGGVWDSDSPTCQAASCDLPVLAALTYPPTLNPNAGPIAYGDSVTVTCTHLRPAGSPLVRQRECVYDQATDSYVLFTDDSLECPIIECGTPPELPGSDFIGPTSTIYGSTLSVECKDLYTMVGSGGHADGDNVVACGEGGYWEFGNLQCEGETCKDPGTPAGGTQIAGTYEEGQSVSFTCTRPGYALPNPTPLVCQVTGNTINWSGTVEPECIDSEAPVFSDCPADVVRINKFDSPGYTIPTPTDNSGSVHSLIVTVDPENFSPLQQLREDITVQYTASDLEGNSATCTVDVHLRDDEVPTITCPKSITRYVSTGAAAVTLNFPGDLTATAIDNLVGTAVPITYDPPSLTIDDTNIGQSLIVKATATDPDGNFQSCRFMVTVKTEVCTLGNLRDPLNGQMTCTAKAGDAGYNCAIVCDADHLLFEPFGASSTTLSCNTGQPFPDPVDCLPVEDASFSFTMKATYTANTTINWATCENEYHSQFITGQEAAAAELSVFSTTNFASGFGVPEISIVPLTADEFLNLEEGTGTTVDITYTFDVKSEGLSKGQQNSIKLVLFALIKSAGQYVQDMVLLPGTADCPAIATDEEDTSDAITSDYRCLEPLFIYAADSVCVPCPYGSYYDGGACTKCDPGTYQNEVKQDSCIDCPTNTWTPSAGTIAEQYCEASCFTYSMVSDNGMPPCDECAVNFFARDATTCEQCPAGSQTHGPGKAAPEDCRAWCVAGQYSATGYEPCSACPVNFYQDGVGESHCTECGGTEITLVEGSTDFDSCIDGVATLCGTNPCQNGGVCSVLQHQAYCECVPGYTGQICDSEINFCESSPCFNEGVCQKETNGYSCDCPTGFSGDRCEIDPENCVTGVCKNGDMCQDLADDFNCLCRTGFGGEFCQDTDEICATNPCKNNGQCDSVTADRRTCTCPDGFQGIDCELNIDECESNPCLNGAACVDGENGYSCTCLDGYDGDNCGTRLDVCAGDPCTGSGQCVDDYSTNNVICVCDTGYETDVSSTAGTWLSAAEDVSIGSCLEVDVCAANPCGANGDCSPGGSGFTCSCHVGFAGQICQHNIDDCATTPCANGAECVDGINDYTCQCPAGFEGVDCEQNIDECDCDPLGTDSSIDCQDLVDGFQCNCRPGFSGPDCSIDIDECASAPCLHGGDCVEGNGDFQCDCIEGWTGDRCETFIDYCLTSSCADPAICHPVFGDYFCECDGRDYGKDCDSDSSTCRDANPCIADDSICLESDTGSATCDCSAEHIGIGCEIIVDFCAGGGICENGGTCITKFNGFECMCDIDFEGDYCETSHDDCAAVTCQGGGSCVDGIGVYYCECPLGKTGTNCAKDIDTDFDLCFDSPDNTGMAAQAYPFIFGLSTFTLGMWVKYDNVGGEGTFFTLYGMDNRNIKADKEEVIRIDHQHIYVTFGGVSQQQEFSSRYDINDHNWYYLTILWDGTTGIFEIRVNSVEITAFDFSASAGQALPPFGWIVLGCQYDPEEEAPIEDMGFKGMVSHINMWRRLLDVDTEIPVMTETRDNLITDGLFLRWSNFQLYSGVDICRPSTAGDEVCPVGFTGPPECTTPAASGEPVAIECPETMWLVGPKRLTKVHWEEPAIIQGTPGTARSTYVNDRVFIWGDYVNTYVVVDDDENAAVCTFDIYVRFQDCDDPTIDPGNEITQVCDDERSPFRTCTPECGENTASPVRTPNFYTCGPQGSFNVWDFYLPFTYPYCSSCNTAKEAVKLSIGYSGLPTDCVRLGDISAFSSKTIERIEQVLDVQWGNSELETQGGFCNGDCDGNVKIDYTCEEGPDGADVILDISVNNLADQLYSGNGTSMTPAQILTTHALDETTFNFDPEIPQALRDLDTIIVNTEAFCEEGQVLNGDKCVDCYKGNYYDAATQTCILCEKAEYQEQAKKTACNPCPTGLTTERPGATSSAECQLKCGLGKYNDGDDNCVKCAIGFYQDEDDQFYCKPCDADKTTTLEGTEREEDCKELCEDGTQPVSDTECEDCPQGTYRTRAVEEFCTPCPEGWTTPGNRSRNTDDCSIPDCLAGSYVTGSNCTKCDYGTYQPEAWQTSCIDCPPGLSTPEQGSTSEDQCQFACPEGQEEVENVADTCRFCLEGTYKDNGLPEHECQPCPEGFLTPDVGATHVDNCTVTDCQAGSFINMVADEECQLCEVGSYTNASQQTECQLCTGEKSTVEKGSDSEDLCVVICDIAEEGDAAGETCVPCPKREYKGESGPQDCTICPNGTTTADEGSTLVEECNIAYCEPGSYRNAAENQCYPCPPAEYQDLADQVSCIPCPDDKVTIGIGKSSSTDCVTNCLSGQEWDFDFEECVVCPRDEYRTQNVEDQCTLCPNNKIGLSASKHPGGNTLAEECFIANCTVGQKMAGGIGDSHCDECPLGEYQDVIPWQKTAAKEEEEECEPCPDGLTTESTGSTSADDCKKDCGDGKQLKAGSDEQCEECPLDTYRNAAETFECVPCPVGSITDDTGSKTEDDCRANNCTEPGYCLNNGTCVSGRCKCTENYDGDRCENRKVKDSIVPYIIGGTIGGFSFLLLAVLFGGLCAWCLRSPHDRDDELPVIVPPMAPSMMGSSRFPYYEDDGGPVKGSTQSLNKPSEYEERMSSMKIN